MNETTSNTPHLQGGNGLLPYPVIVSAVSGNVDAINVVLEHFAGFISALSTRTMYDEQGKPVVYIDEELRRRLETKLIAKIPTFKVA